MNDSSYNRHIYVLTGPVQGGKTTSVSELVKALRKRGLRVMGFSCPGELSKGRRSAFHLHNLENGVQILMGRDEEQKGWIKFRRFYFNPDGFVLGERWIKESILSDPDLLVIDEVGPMELEGLGWSKILDTLVEQDSIIQLWLVREQILPEVLKKWRIADSQVFTLETIENFTRIWRS